MSNRRAPKWSRRQVLKVVAASMALPLGALALRGLAGQPGYHIWEGESLGGPVSLTLWHQDANFARSTITRMRAEIERLEAIFSLFRHDSEISRLNRDGAIERPSSDLVAVLTETRRMSEWSGGAFDPSVQPLWRLYETHFRLAPEAIEGPPGQAVEAARALVGYGGIDIEARRIRLAKTGMAITLNSIAQGHITDRVADLLRQEGYEHAMVELGETRALGGQPEGGKWSIRLKDPRNPLALNREVAVADEAVSVSGGYGLHFGRSNIHHIFDPATGRSAERLLDVAVIAPRAASANLLSTAIFVGGEAAAQPLLAKYPGARAILTRLDGSTASA